jgi:hypothetical protein
VSQAGAVWPGCRRCELHGTAALFAGNDAGREKAQEITALWAVLSALTHHHGYELPPTRAELNTLVARTERVLAYFAVGAATPLAGEDRDSES